MIKRKFLYSLVMSAFLVGLMVSAAAAVNYHVSSVAFTQANLSLMVGKSATVTAQVSIESGSGTANGIADSGTVAYTSGSDYSSFALQDVTGSNITVDTSDNSCTSSYLLLQNLFYNLHPCIHNRCRVLFYLSFI